MARIFISYAREDETKVSALYSKLKDAGFTPWMDVEYITPGEDWERAINTAIRESHFVIVCLSPHFVAKRGFIQREIKISADRHLEMMADDIVVIPARLEECPAPEELRKFQWVDLFRDNGWSKLLKALQVGAERRGIVIGATDHRQPNTGNRPRTDHQQPTTDHQLPSFDFTTVTLDRVGNVVKRPQGSARYFTEETGGIDLDMVHIPSGTFEMGTNASEKLADSELPQHEVTVPSFFMGKFQITQAQWRTVARWSKVKLDLSLDPSSFKGDTLPVEQVSWEDAQEFCARLSKKTGKLYRLPTEAEWEYACRAGTMTPYAFGETITPEFVNYDGNRPYAGAKKGEYRKQTTPVGSLGLANGFGLFDMHGNVWEWCEDVRHENYDDAPKDGSAWLSSGDSSFRVLRGGSWSSYGVSCRSAYRLRYGPGLRIGNFGLRVVVSART